MNASGPTQRGQQRLWQQADGRAIWLHQRPLFCLLAGLMAGSVLGRTVAVSPLLIVALPVILICVWRRWPYGHLQRCCRLLLAGFLLTHMHLAWHDRALPLDHMAQTRQANPRQRLRIEGHLYRTLEDQGDRQRLYLQLHRLHDAQGWRPVSGRVRLTVQTTPLTLLPGDIVQVHDLRLYPVRNFENPGRFDYRRLMHQQGIYAVGGVHRPERLQLVQRPRGWGIARTLARWRHHLVTIANAHLPLPLNAILTAMVLGQYNNLPAATQNAFRTTGAAHLLVVSGLHVGFVATVCFIGLRTVLRLLRGCLPPTCLPAWRPTPLAAVLCLPPIFLYCSLVGWRISTIRAALMVGCYLLALMVTRGRDMLYTLGLAAGLILLCDPHALFTLGFQLSFVAVAAIILVGQRLTPRDPSHVTIRRWQQRLWLALLSTSAAYAGTVPLLASAFHTIPTYGSLSNVLLVPLAGLIVPAGAVALLLSVLWPALAPWVFAPLAVLLGGLHALVQYVAALPGAQLHVAAPSALMLIAYYGLLGRLLTLRRRSCLPWVGIWSALLLAGVAWQYIEARPQHLRITFLDVGTGDAILVQAPGNRTLLIDGGGTYDGRFDIGTNVVAPVLWQRYIRRFELMALTHTHPNHARGLVRLFQLFPTRHLLTNGSPLQNGYLHELATTAAQRGTPIHSAPTGPRQWQWGKLQLTVLSPPAAVPSRHADWHPPTENDRSLVLRLQYGAFRILLTGDIQHATERWLLTQDIDLQADILQVPHHGSRTSTSSAFVQRVQPQVGIISAGAGNPYGHPHPRVLDVLEKQHVRVLRTDRHGAVTIISDGTTYQVLPFRVDRSPLRLQGP